MYSEPNSAAGIKCVLERLRLEEGPYIALFLKEVDHADIDREQLRLPLMAAFSMSMHLRLILPVNRSNLLLVDDVISGLFKRQSQTSPKAYKDFVVRSKGILYIDDATSEEKMYILRCAAFLMTTDVGIWQTASGMRLPSAFISQCENKGPEILIPNYGDIEDKQLRRCITIARGMLATPQLVI